MKSVISQRESIKLYPIIEVDPSHRSLRDALEVLNTTTDQGDRVAGVFLAESVDSPNEEDEKRKQRNLHFAETFRILRETNSNWFIGVNFPNIDAMTAYKRVADLGKRSQALPNALWVDEASNNSVVNNYRQAHGLVSVAYFGGAIVTPNIGYRTMTDLILRSTRGTDAIVVKKAIKHDAPDAPLMAHLRLVASLQRINVVGGVDRHTLQMYNTPPFAGSVDGVLFLSAHRRKDNTIDRPKLIGLLEASRP